MFGKKRHKRPPSLPSFPSLPSLPFAGDVPGKTGEPGLVPGCTFGSGFVSGAGSVLGLVPGCSFGFGLFDGFVDGDVSGDGRTLGASALPGVRSGRGVT